MKLKVIHTGSKGNCYQFLPTNGKSLMIDCGGNWDNIKASIGFKFSDVQAWLITHSHGDHNKNIQKVVEKFVPIYTGQSCAESSKILDYRKLKLFNLNIFGLFDKFTAGDFTVQPLLLDHDVQCFGFLIHHPECGQVVFATDTTTFDYRTTKVSHFVIEANFDEDILFSNDAPIFLNDRVYKSHMSLQTCVKVLTRQDLKKCKSITLIHLSDRNSDEIKFKSTIEGKFGIPVTVAENGTEIILKTEI